MSHIVQFISEMIRLGGRDKSRLTKPSCLGEQNRPIMFNSRGGRTCALVKANKTSVQFHCTS